MQDPVPWESELHNHDRTFARGEYRYTNRRIRGVELTELADPSWSSDADPGFHERACEFLRKHAHLLDRYHTTAKGRKRRRLSRRILDALCADELLSTELLRHLLEHGPRSRVRRAG